MEIDRQKAVVLGHGSRPRTAFFELTTTCNFFCGHCYNHSRRRGRNDTPLRRAALHLSAVEVSDNIKALFRLGVSTLHLTGGEVLLYSGFFSVLEQARVGGMGVVVKTNSSRLTSESCERLASLGVLRIGTTLYGGTPETHDAFVGVPGGFRMAVQGICNAVERGLNVVVTMLLHRDNWHEIGEVPKLEASLGAPIRLSNTIDSRFDGSADPLELRAPNGVVAEVLRQQARAGQIKRIGDRERMGCRCGKHRIAVAANGDVLPCIGVPLVCGNTRDAPLDEIWRESPQLKWIRNLDQEDFADCLSCPDKGYCGRTSGGALLNGGSFTGKDPVQCERAALLRELVESGEIVTHAPKQ